MAEELQSLLDRIQKDGVDKAEAEAAEIVKNAKDEANSIVAKAKEEAKELREEGKKDAKAFQERTEKALEQAARDIILTVEDAVSATMQAIVKDSVDEAMSIDVLKDALVEIVQAYVKKEKGSPDIELLLSAKDQKKVADFFAAKYAAAIKKGLTIKSDSEILSGFKVSISGGSVYHDFTQEAIVEALCAFLRPRLAEIVRKAVTKKSKK